MVTQDGEHRSSKLIIVNKSGVIHISPHVNDLMKGSQVQYTYILPIKYQK